MAVMPNRLFASDIDGDGVAEWREGRQQRAVVGDVTTALVGSGRWVAMLISAATVWSSGKSRGYLWYSQTFL